MRIHLHDVLPFIIVPAIPANLLPGDLTSRDSVNTTGAIPSPLVVPPSQYWDGDNGQWSSFAVRVGTPAQDVRVLVSTNSPETMVVLPLGCTSAAINPVPGDCANARGRLFNPNSSSTWQDQGFFGINTDGVGFEADLGYSQNADYGLETLGLGYVAGGAGGPTLQNQTVAGIATASPFYLGILGLNTQPVNYSTIGNFSAPSYFTSLREQQLIPSLSWSYTAGAKYRLKDGQYGQLIFGGYDSSRFTPNSATFTLNEDIDRDIVVAIQSITYSGTTQAVLLSTPTFAFIESTDPNIWLPEAACKAFEEAFNISIDNSTGLYLINATHYAQLQAANPQVTFTLANSLSGGETVNIVLPFNALGLSTSYPFTPNDTYYFPLRKAANDSQNTLGRAFLQEAYLTVDYERGNFSVSQCLWNDGAAQQIGTILSPSYSTNTTSSSGHSASSTSKPIGVGAIAGAAIAGVAVLALAGGVAYYFIRRRNRPVSAAPTDDIALTNINAADPKEKEGSFPQPHFSPYPADKKLYPSSSIHRSIHHYQPNGELGTSGEIFQLSSQDDRERLYFTPADQISPAERVANTPQIDGRSIVYELHGSELTPAEMDDEWSRQGSPRMPASRSLTRVSSRSTSPFPPSASFI